MQEEITTLRNELIQHRQATHKRSVPDGFWPRVKKLLEKVPSKELALQLGVDHAHLKRRLGLQKTLKSKASPNSAFMRLPSIAAKKREPVMEIEVTEDITIKVYS